MMIDRRHILAAILALTLLPFAAPAAGEDALEAAPEVTLTEESPAESVQAEEEEYPEYAFWQDPYLPDRIYPNRDEEYQNEEWIYSEPGLTLAEYNRVKELMAAVEAGEQSLDDQSYPEHPDEVKVGVYPLNPADFSGETYYVTLPSRKLKDFDLLYLLSCFDQLGIPFDPDELYSRNCMRGYINDGTNRKLSEEENTRMKSFRRMIARGLLDEADIHPETECRSIPTWFGPITLYPYRRMTDDELAAFAFARESDWENDPDDVEEAAREFVSSIVRLPISMELTEAWRSLIPYTDSAEGYGLTFTIEYTDSQGNTLRTGGKPCSVYVYLRRRLDNGELVGSIASVYYFPDYNMLFRREQSEVKSREEKLEIGTEFLKENVLTLDDSYQFTYDDDYGYYRIWAENMNWAFFAEMAEDGFIEQLSIQRLI